MFQQVKKFRNHKQFLFELVNYFPKMFLLDLHPGNILVRGSLDDPSQIKLVILDSGIVATLAPQDFRNLYDTFS